MSRTCAPSATLVVADVFRARPSRPVTLHALHHRPVPSQALLSLVTTSGLHATRADPIRSVAWITDAVVVTARKQP